MPGDLELYRADGRLINPFDPDRPDPDLRRDPRAAAYHRSRLSDETRRAYKRYIDLYLDFCYQTGRDQDRASQYTLEAYIIWLCQRPITRGKNKGKVGLSPSALSVALSAVRTMYEILGGNIPASRLARGIIEGHEAQRETDPDIHDGEGSPAVDLPTFQELVEACPAHTNAGIRDRAMLTIGLTIMARRRELAGLSWPDITRDRGADWLKVHIRRAKGGKPRSPVVPRWDHLPILCPHRNWDTYVERMASLGITEGPTFRAVDQWDNVQGAKNGRWAGKTPPDGGRLDPATLESIILRAAIRASVPNAESLRPHGVLRASGATIAYNFGADVLAIARQGGWGERSPVVFRYIRDIDQYKRNPMLLVGKGDKE